MSSLHREEGKREAGVEEWKEVRLEHLALAPQFLPTCHRGEE